MTVYLFTVLVEALKYEGGRHKEVRSIEGKNFASETVRNLRMHMSPQMPRALSALYETY